MLNIATTKSSMNWKFIGNNETDMLGGTRMTRIGRIYTDAKSVCIRVIRAIRVLFHIKLTNNNGFFISICELSLISAIRTSAFICVHLRSNELNKLFCFHNNYD
ncbi:MAG TPA: hypothetical protein VIO11_03750 [Candidatus Methanoperedens sp.]